MIICFFHIMLVGRNELLGYEVVIRKVRRKKKLLGNEQGN